MLEMPISFPEHDAILKLDGDKKGIVSERQHVLETKFSKEVSDAFYFWKSGFLH